MEDIIVIKDLNFGYRDMPIFNHFSLTIKAGSFTTFVGPNGSGKSTLVKLFVGLLSTDSYISIDSITLCHNNIKEIRKRIGIVFENPDNQFVAETVMDDIAFSLENMGYAKNEIRKKVMEISLYLGIKPLLEKEPHCLSGGEKQLVALASALVSDPKILILDEAFTMLDGKERKRLFEILEELHQKGMTILNITHDLEDALYGDEVLVIQDGTLILKGATKDVLREEKILKQVGLDLPFVVDLSNKLRYYGLVDDIYLNMEALVDHLWK